MKKITLSLLLLSISLPGFCIVWTVNSSGNTYTPASITITLGDSVNFVIASSHDAREVSQTTYNANGNTILTGGFQTSFGGGLVLPAQLSVGTHYYVCTPHAQLGMKGLIIVQNATSIVENQLQTTISIYPNPSNGNFQLEIDGPQFTKSCKVEIYNIQEQKIYQSLITNSKSNINVNNEPNGIYFVRIYGETEIYERKIIVQ